MGSPVPIVIRENTKRGITYKLPINYLEPKELLQAKQKNKVNAAKLAQEVRRSQAIEAERHRQERLESQARFAGILRAERERQASQSSVRGPGVRGTAGSSNILSLLGNTSGKTLRKANVLKGQRSASKGIFTSKFWKKEGTNESNSD